MSEEESRVGTDMQDAAGRCVIGRGEVVARWRNAGGHEAREGRETVGGGVSPGAGRGGDICAGV